MVKTTADKFKDFVGIEKPEEEKTLQDDMEDCCKMSRTNRMYGFGACFTLGWVVSFLACLSIPDIAKSPEKFTFLYTLGNIICICSTMFLNGPCKQIKKMFHPCRRWATAIYLFAIVLTIVIAFTVELVIPVLVCLFIQLLAMIWYAASYFPYGHKILKGIMKSVCPCFK